MDLLNSNKRKKAQDAYEAAVVRYKSARKNAGASIYSLYQKRKKAVSVIEHAEDLLLRLPDFGMDNIKKISQIKASIRSFTESPHYVIADNSTTGNMARHAANPELESVGLLKGQGIVSEIASALIGIFADNSKNRRDLDSDLLRPKTAEVLSTTFRPSTAVSASLDSPAIASGLSTLYALAGEKFIGKKTLGYTKFPFLGSIGAVIGSVAYLSLSSYRNKDIAKKVGEETKRINEQIVNVKDLTSEVDATCQSIDVKLSELNSLMEKIKNHEQTVDDYDMITNYIVSICELINKKFSI